MKPEEIRGNINKRTLMDVLQARQVALLVSMPCNQMEIYEAAVAGGADAVKMHINVEHRASGNTFGTFEENEALIRHITSNSDIPAGIVAGGSLEVVTEQLTEQLIQSGINFVSLYAHHAPARLLSDDRWIKMLAASNEYSLEQIVSLTSLNMDILESSIMAPEKYGERLTVQDLAAYKLLADKVSKPIIVPSQKHILAEDLPALCQTGIKGIMIGAIVTGKDADSVYKATKQFREKLDEIYS